jgi:hypothetical protein
MNSLPFRPVTDEFQLHTDIVISQSFDHLDRQMESFFRHEIAYGDFWTNNTFLCD